MEQTTEVNNKIEKLNEYIKSSERIVFFGGAGVSTESGIPDFRSVDGLYHMKYKYPPETILSHTFFLRHTKEFYEFYKDKMLYLDVEPNITHTALAQLEEQRKLSAVITQNIDGLHQKAGSKKVLELHGSVLRNFCMKCKKSYPIEFIKETEEIPYCSCGGIIKPDVVLYEESLEENTLQEAVQVISEADLLIVGGTSLCVYPAAGLISYYKGDKLVLINKSETSYDNEADLLINAGLGEVFSKII